MAVEGALLRIGSTVVSAAVRKWLTDRRSRDERSLPLADLVNRRLTDAFGRRRLTREMEAMADAVAERLAPLNEQSRVRPV